MPKVAQGISIVGQEKIYLGKEDSGVWEGDAVSGYY